VLSDEALDAAQTLKRFSRYPPRVARPIPGIAYRHDDGFPCSGW
jgi:hypothetical protein